MSEKVLADSITIDEQECAFFTKASSVWWDMIFLKGLHDIDKFNLDYVMEILTANNIKQDESVNVLDAGCGGGIVSEIMARYGYTVVGIDVNSALIKVAEKHADGKFSNLKYQFESMEEHAAKNEKKYDVIMLNYILQHVTHHEVILESCIKMLKPGGFIFIGAVGKTLKSLIDIKIIGERIIKNLPLNGHNWRNFINCEKVEAILKSNDCIVKERRGFNYNPFRSEYFWCTSVDVFYYLYAVKSTN